MAEENIFDQSGLRSRVLSSLGANSFAQGVTLLSQLASVPLFLHYWGNHLYGEWMILAAIPGYLSLVDFGYGLAASNRMIIVNRRGHSQRMTEFYQTALACTTVLVFGTSVLLALSFLLGAGRIFALEKINPTEFEFILSCLAVQVAASMFSNLSQGGFRALGRNATGITFLSVVRLAEWVSLVIAIILGAGPTVVAFTIALTRIIGAIWIQVSLSRVSSCLRFGFKRARMRTMKVLFKPGVAYMVVPMALALNIQGLVLVVGATLGAIAVTLFSIYRTYSRTAVQLVTIVNQSLWPEMTAAYGSRNSELLGHLHRRSFAFATWLGLLVLVASKFCGAALIQLWTVGRVSDEISLMWLLLFAAFVGSLWQGSWVLTMAANKHAGTSTALLCSAALTLGLSVPVAPVWGLNGIAAVMVIAELLMLLYVVRKAIRITNEQLRYFLLSPIRALSLQR